MRVRLYSSYNSRSYNERELEGVTKFPTAIYCDGFFYLHLTEGYYSPIDYYLIPPTPIEEES
jgi:hypothetical protein